MLLSVNFNGFFILAFLSVKCLPLLANNTKTDTTKISNLNSHLFNGSIYNRYAANAVGYPYFATNKPMTGSVHYDTHLYKNVQLQLDIYTQELVLSSPLLQQPITLVTSKIDSFTIGNHRFINIKQTATDEPLSGFVELIYEGLLTSAFAKHEKRIEQSLRSDDSKQYLNEYNTFFIRYKNKLTIIGNESDLLNVFKEDKARIKKLLRDKKLSFKKNPRLVLQESLSLLEQF